MGEGGVKWERDAATDAVARPVTGRKATRTGDTWTLDSLVEDVLLEGCCGLGGVSLHDFLMEHFKKTFESLDVSLYAFIHKPNLCLTDESALTVVTKSAPYREFAGKYELYEAMKKEADRLNDVGIFSLRQWARAADNEVRDITLRVKGKLDAALGVARGNAEAMRIVYAFGGEVLDDVYDSVLSARWSCVVRSDEYDEKWLGMGVVGMAPGEQPQLWSKEQADVKCYHCNPWDGDEVPGVNGKLVMAVLSSQKGWPYMLFDAEKAQLEEVDTLTCYNAACDAYIRKEDQRVWHIVKESIDRWKSGVGIFRPLLVIGTRGIGKSSGTGSLLLHQLLHYPLKRLKVVAYFVKGEAYLFHKPGGQQRGRVVHYGDQGAAVGKIRGMISSGIEGYIIFDIDEESIDVEVLPNDWGIVLISWPNEGNFGRFLSRRTHTLPIYINCYEDAEFKASLVWERYQQLAKGQLNSENVNLECGWEIVKKRIQMVGPVPRYAMGNEATFEKRVEEVKSALELVPYDIDRCAELLNNPHEWHENGPTHKLMKVTRRTVRDQLMCWDDPISTYVQGELQGRMFKAPLTEDVIRRVLFSKQARND
ncbi:unnamed protein product [Trypanosoma congolense IL3000]|uniref:WGS project CAEQ00000000 data, annotated contig 2448 n=1 Tax=Trypanosoma congolense (strain IL3000) TaxID=1068625 RepID=F9WE95_TRYCI|nr:unnamed protein product [Trypanosoma congolense IL3000]